MKLNFGAIDFEIDPVDLRVGFSDGEDGEHYFLIQRDDESTEEVLPNRENIYTELDDQCWGGNGGIDLIACSQSRFTIHLGEPIAPRIGYNEISITFSLNDSEFQELRKVLQKIMKGYEDRLNLID